jgi:hypothetical protein
MQALCILAAQTAAKSRRARASDPTEYCERIDREFLRQQGLSTPLINERILNQFLSLSNTFWVCGAKNQSLRVLEQAMRWLKSVERSRSQLALLNSAFASRYFNQRRIVSAAAAFARVLENNPMFAFRLISHAIAKPLAASQ